MKKTIWILIAFALIGFNYVSAQNNKTRGWTVKNILDVMRWPARGNIGEIPIIAHRGYWRGAKLNGINPASALRWYPENSFASVLNCHLNGIEAAEIDIRTTLDGIPYLMHDKTLGRTTNQSWNPMTHIGENTSSTNLNFSAVPKFIRAWDYNNNRKVVGNTHPLASTGAYGDEPRITSFDNGHGLPTLRALLRWYKKYDIRVALFLEIQTPYDFENIYRVVDEENAFNFCVFKLGIGGGPEEGYFPMLIKAGIFKKRIHLGKTYYDPVKRDASNTFNYTTIAYENSSKGTKDFIAYVQDRRITNAANGINQIFCEIVAKTDIVANTRYLYDLALDCYKSSIPVGGYWVIAPVQFKSRENPTQTIKGYITGSGNNISNQGKAIIDLAGSCCGIAGSNEFQTSLSNVLMKLGYDPDFPNRIPSRSGMATDLVTSDEVEQLVERRDQDFMDNLYAGNTSPNRSSNSEFTSELKDSKVNIESSIAKSLNIYPNPVQQECKVNFITANTQEVTISLVNTDGKVLFQQKHKTRVGNNVFLINTQSITNGTYFIRVQTSDNIATKTVVVLK